MPMFVKSPGVGETICEQSIFCVKQPEAANEANVLATTMCRMLTVCNSSSMG